jgi:signal transduction histidine kinase
VNFINRTFDSFRSVFSDPLFPYLGTYSVSALLAGVLGYLTLIHTEMRSRPWFGTLVSTLSLWSAVAAGGLLLPGQSIQFLVQRIWALLGLSVVMLWVVFTAHYTLRSPRTNPVVRTFGVVYVLLLVLAVTIPYHDLYYASLTYHRTPFFHTETTPGPARILVVGYTIAGICIGTYYLWRLFEGSRHRSRTPTVVLAVAVLLGFVPFLASELRRTPVQTYNHTIFGVSVFVLGVSYSVYRHSFYDLAPIARDTLVDEIDDPMFVVDSNLRLVDYNAAATTILPGFTVDRVGASFPELRPELAEIVGEPPPDRREECTLSVAGDSRHFSVLVSDVTVYAESEGSVILLRDITERRERERQLEETKAGLEEANEKLDDFASLVAHDLRNPLTVAIGFLEVAAETGNPEHFERVASAHDRIERLVEDVLALARGETTIEDPEPIDLGAVAAEAWQYVDTGGATFRVADDVPVVAGDAGHLTQLFENLFRNAVEHGGVDVTVTVGRLADGAGFYVEDDGTGIPSDRQSELFERGVSSDEGGTGLGLSIVATVANAHGWAASATEGSDGGARFEFDTSGRPVSAEGTPVDD